MGYAFEVVEQRTAHVVAHVAGAVPQKLMHTEDLVQWVAHVVQGIVDPCPAHDLLDVVPHNAALSEGAWG